MPKPRYTQTGLKLDWDGPAQLIDYKENKTRK